MSLFEFVIHVDTLDLTLMTRGAINRDRNKVQVCAV